jgi:Linalool dehydratase/isomerase
LMAGYLLVALSASTDLRALGLSLVIPGAGLAYTGHPVWCFLVLVLFCFALVMWWAVSAVFGPPLVYALGAVGAVVSAGHPGSLWSTSTSWLPSVIVVSVVYLAVVGMAVTRFERAYRHSRAEVSALNEYLAKAEVPTPVRVPVSTPEFDSSVLAWLLELALQPLDSFEGFDHGEQYHGATCLRYQLNFFGATLAVANVNMLPNYPSLVSRAQENLVRKNTDIRVWRYWALENLLGNFDRNPDPIVRDNIMLSGFLANQISEYEAATGSKVFDHPGALRFIWRDGREFVYDHDSIVDVVVGNFRRSRLGLFPCEPGWVFATCNAIAAQGVLGYDAVHGDSRFASMESTWRHGMFGEMMTPHGAIRHIRSTLFGLTFRDGEGTGEYFLPGTHLLADTAPDMALRGTLLQLRSVRPKIEMLRGLITERNELGLELAPKREKGTRQLSTLTEWSGIVIGALMSGDQAVAEAALRSLVKDCQRAGHFPVRPLHGRAMGIAALAGVLWGTDVSLAELAVRGWQPPRGPILDEAPWPAILVSRAVSRDGVSLDLRVEPYRADPGAAHDLVFSRIDSLATYEIISEDGSCRVDALDLESDGRLRARVSLSHRGDLTLRVKV